MYIPTLQGSWEVDMEQEGVRWRIVRELCAHDLITGIHVTSLCVYGFCCRRFFGEQAENYFAV